MERSNWGQGVELQEIAPENHNKPEMKVNDSIYIS